jgi:hypothetical protein
VNHGILAMQVDVNRPAPADVVTGMLLAACTSCDRRELRGFRGIDAAVNGPDGFELRFACRVCGAQALAVDPCARYRAAAHASEPAPTEHRH